MSSSINYHKTFMDINKIKKIIPHRYPFLLIDKIIDYKEKEYLIALKNVTANEEVFNGHFPDRPVFPGVLIIEAMAQAGAVMVCLENKITNPSLPVAFMSIDKCRFRAPVIPGDTLIIKITPINIKQTLAKVQCTALVNEKLVSEAIVTAMIGKTND